MSAIQTREREAVFAQRLARLRAGIQASELGNERLVDFIPRLTPKYTRPAHLSELLDRFERAVRGEPQRVCCSAPPRHAKTESMLHVPAYMLRRRPDWTISYTTYGDALSRSKARKARALALREGIQLEAKAIGEWRTAEGGGMLSGGVGGPLTGHGVNIVVIDDPVKNRVEAESPTVRDRLRDFFDDVAVTRVEPGGSIFIFMTRWTTDDLIGHAVKEKGFEYICLPAINDDGSPLWPERWSLEELEAKRELVGAYTWESLYQQRPRPRGSVVFGPPSTYKKLPTVYITAFGLDLAYSSKSKSDWSVMVKGVKGRDADGVERCFVTHVERLRVQAPVFRAVCHYHHAQTPGARWLWYAAGTELGVGDFLRRGADSVPVVSETTKGDKFVRSIPYAAAWNAGRVVLPESAPWLNEFVSVHSNFTGSGKDACDDDVDAGAAWFDALSANVAVIAPEVARPTRKSLAEQLGG